MSNTEQQATYYKRNGINFIDEKSADAYFESEERHKEHMARQRIALEEAKRTASERGIELFDLERFANNHIYGKYIKQHAAEELERLEMQYYFGDYKTVDEFADHEYDMIEGWVS
jgi:hypothetical protein